MEIQEKNTYYSVIQHSTYMVARDVVTDIRLEIVLYSLLQIIMTKVTTNLLRLVTAELLLSSYTIWT